MLRVLHVSVVLATILNQCVGGDGVKHIRPSYLAAEYTGPVNDTPTTLFLKLKGGDSPVGYAPVYINGKPIYRFTQPNFKNEIAPSVMLYDNQAGDNQIGFIHTSCSYPIQIGWMFDQIGWIWPIQSSVRVASAVVFSAQLNLMSLLGFPPRHHILVMENSLTWVLFVIDRCFNCLWMFKKLFGGCFGQ